MMSPDLLDRYLDQCWALRDEGAALALAAVFRPFKGPVAIQGYGACNALAVALRYRRGSPQMSFKALQTRSMWIRALRLTVGRKPWIR